MAFIVDTVSGMSSMSVRRPRRVLNAIIGPRALSWQVGVWALGGTSLLNLLSDPYVNFRASFELGITPFLASVPALAVMLIINEATKRFSRGRAIIVLLTYIVVTNIRPLFMFVLVSDFAPDVTTNPLFRPLGSLVTIGVLIVVSFANNVVSAFQSGMTHASVTRDRLNGALNLARTELERPTPQLDDNVRTMIAGVVSDIRHNLSERHDSADLQRLADDVTTLSTQRIRRVSHEFSQRWTRAEVPDFPETHRAYTRELVRASTAGDLYSPFIVSLLTAAAAAYGFLPGSSNALLALALVGLWFTVNLVSLVIARAVHRRLWPQRRGRASFEILFFLITCLMSAELASMVTGVFGSDLDGVLNISLVTQFVTVPMLAVSVSLCVALGSGVLDASSQLLAQAGRMNREIERVLVRVTAQRLRTQGALAQFLHGRIQGQLLAVSLLARTHLDAGESVDAVRDRIEHVLDDISIASLDSIESPTTAAGLVALNDSWENMVSLTFNVNTESERRLDADSLGRFIFFDVVRESVNNAVKHGHTKNITVSSDLTADDELDVSVTNDGLPWVTTESGGAGIRALESVTTSLRVEILGAETTLRVSIPLAPVAS